MSRRPDGRRVALATLGALGAILAACGGGDRPSPRETAVCDGVERVVERLAARDGRGALVATTRLAGLVRTADNTVLSTAGNRFFTVIGETRDVGTYTTEQLHALGRQVMESGASALGRMVRECDRVGAPVAWLDAVPTDLSPTTTLPISAGFGSGRPSHQTEELHDDARP